MVSIADQIKTAARRFDDHKLPSNHAGIVIWSGADFSWESFERKDVLAQNDSYLEDKVAVLARELSVSNGRSWSRVGPPPFMVRDPHGSES